MCVQQTTTTPLRRGDATVRPHHVVHHRPRAPRAVLHLLLHPHGVAEEVEVEVQTLDPARGLKESTTTTVFIKLLTL